MTAELLLEIDSVHAGYGRVDVLHDICITLKQGEFISIVGPNGAGKTTLFKTISGLVTPSAGSIKYKGNDLLSVEASRRAYLGLSHVPEGRQVFPALTVLENLEMGAFARNNNQEFSASLEKIYTWFPILKDRQAQTAADAGHWQRACSLT